MSSYPFSQIGICWPLGTHSGWGTFALNFAVECARRGIAPALFRIDKDLVLSEEQASLLGPSLQDCQRWHELLQGGTGAMDFPFLHALGDTLDFLYPTTGLTGKPDIGVVFFESGIIPPANVARADRFAKIITGSSWNQEVLDRHGYARGVFCPQGVDLARFRPLPRQNSFAGRFTIFSGGKLEYRKGQDIVVAAFKRFYERHPDALLVTAWNSPWPQFAASMANSRHTKGYPGVDANGDLDAPAWLKANGLPETAIATIRALPNAVVPDLLKEMDLAVFASRCEGGTNLTAMECMAMGVPVVLSQNTGHHDLIANANCYVLEDQQSVGKLSGQPQLDDWGESSVEELVARMEQAYTDRADAAARGAAGAAFMKTWDWPTQVEKVLKAIAA